jgi:hypothetical protein
MRQVIMFHSPGPQLRPLWTHNRGYAFTILPHETFVVCIKIKSCADDFSPLQPYRSNPLTKQLCYLVKNQLDIGFKCKNTSLFRLLSQYGLTHQMVFLPTDSLIILHQKWLRGYRVWYTLRTMYVMSNTRHKRFQIL